MAVAFSSQGDETPSLFTNMSLDYGYSAQA